MPDPRSFGSWLGRRVLSNLGTFVREMNPGDRYRAGKVLATLVGIIIGGLLVWDESDPRFKRVDIPFNQAGSPEWQFWLVFNVIALICLMIGIGYILSRPMK